MKNSAGYGGRIRERLTEFREADRIGRRQIHESTARHKAASLERRRALGRSYLERASPFDSVPRDRGFSELDLSSHTEAVRAEALHLADGQPARRDNRALEFPIIGDSFDRESAAVAFATSPEVLAPVVDYFGMLPVMFNIFVTRAHTRELITDSAHLFHVDPEDVVSLKAFLHLTPVDEQTGPLHLLRADVSENLMVETGYRGIARITDEEMNAQVGWQTVRQFCGPPGHVVLADTTRCLHFGGRPRQSDRPLREMLVVHYLLPTSPLFPIDGDDAVPRLMPRLVPDGDEHWDALIGATLI